jgi:lysozyme
MGFFERVKNVFVPTKVEPEIVYVTKEVIKEVYVDSCKPRPAEEFLLGSAEQDELLMQDLISNEGYVAHAYQDSKGFWTAGIGRLLDRRRGGGLSMEEAVYLAKNDIRKSIALLDEHLPWWRNLSPVRRRVMIELVFNMGIGNSSSGLLSFKNTLPAIQRGDYQLAATGLRNSKWARDVGPKRSGKMIQMLLEG